MTKNLTTMKDQDKRFTLLQIGHTGAGKTTRALKATRFGRVLIFDFDHKVGALIASLPEEDQKLIDVACCENFMDAWDDLLALEKENPYATIILDTYTKLNAQAYDLALGKQSDKLQVSTDFKTFGNLGRACDLFISKLKALNVNLIINAHTGTDGMTDPIQGLGKQGKTLPYFMQHTQYLYIWGDKFNIKARNSSTYPANSPIPAKFVDVQGNCKGDDLDCFDYCAFTAKEPK